MSASPVSGASSAAQLALQQIRALRQAAPAQAPLATAPVAAVAPTRAARTPAPKAADLQALNQLLPNRPRGSLVNIVA